MALIPEEPRKRNAFLAVAVALLAFAAFWLYVHSPAVEQLAVEEERLETLDARNRAAQLVATRGGSELEEQLTLYERHVMQLEQLIPAGEEVPNLLRSIQSEAARVNVDVDYFGPDAEQPGEFYTRQAWEIRAIGSYHDVGRFLTSIASLPRIITPVDLELEQFEDPRGVYGELAAPVLATFRIETYVLPQPGQQMPPAEASAEEAA